MKYLILIILSLSFTAQAQEVPKYLEDGVITVTLKNGKQYTFSANEYAVVRRGAKKIDLARAPQEDKPSEIVFIESSQPKRLKHIVSGEVLRSNSGELDTSRSSSTLNVQTKKAYGVGMQYQYNIHKDVYMGGRVDTNGGAGVSLGLGF